MKPARLVPASILFAAITPGLALAQTPSFSRTDLETGLPLTQRVIAADFNRDGRADLLVTSHSMEEPFGIYEMLGHGDGTFDPPVRVGPGFGSSLGAADVTGDGILDLVFVSGDNLWTLPGVGDGTFGPARLSPPALSGAPPAFADVDGDGSLDLVLPDQDDGVLVSLGNGDGTFGPPMLILIGGRVPRVVAGDVNGDGKADLLAANIGQPDEFLGSVVSVLLGNGDGTFRRGNDVGVGPTPLSLALFDADGDGRLDIAATSYAAGLMSVALGNGDGTFAPSFGYPAPGPGTADTAAADFNGDGRPDVAICAAADLMSIFSNAGGTFVRSDFPAASSCTSIAVADFDGDGRPDLALNYYAASGTVSIFRNTTAPLDTQPPSISAAATPRLLWPANGATVAVTVSGTIGDDGSGIDPSTLAFTVVDEYGVVQPSGTFAIDAAGHYSFAVPLTASRRGNDADGRTYRIVVRAADRAGNQGSSTVVVTVPHDRGR